MQSPPSQTPRGMTGNEITMSHHSSLEVPATQSHGMNLTCEAASGTARRRLQNRPVASNTSRRSEAQPRWMMFQGSGVRQFDSCRPGSPRTPPFANPVAGPRQTAGGFSRPHRGSTRGGSTGASPSRAREHSNGAHGVPVGAGGSREHWSGQRRKRRRARVLRRQPEWQNHVQGGAAGRDRARSPEASGLPLHARRGWGRSSLRVNDRTTTGGPRP